MQHTASQKYFVSPVPVLLELAKYSDESAHPPSTPVLTLKSQ